MVNVTFFPKSVKIKVKVWSHGQNILHGQTSFAKRNARVKHESHISFNSEVKSNVTFCSKHKSKINVKG